MIEKQNLSTGEIYNVWCDCMAKETWHNGSISLYDFEVLPDECWAIYSKHPTFHKIIGSWLSVSTPQLAILTWRIT
jgi:hypothetical protein